MKIKKIISIILALVTVFSLTSCSVTRKSIDLKDFVTVTFDSYNGFSSPEMEVDYQLLSHEFDTEKMVKYFKKVCPEDAQVYNEFGDDQNFSTYLSIEFEKDYNYLSNGDEVVVKTVVSSEMESAGQTIEDVEKGLGVKFKNATFTVEGLEDAKGLKVIENIEDWIVYAGANGDGAVTIDGPDDLSFQIDDFYFTGHYNAISIVHNNTSLGYLTVRIKNDETYPATELKKGDTILVYLDGKSVMEKLDEMGYVIERTEFKATVPDLGEYITDKDKLTEKNIKRIQKELSEKVIDKNGNGKLISTYFAKAKPGVACEKGKVGLVVAIYESIGGLFGNRKGMYVIEADSIIKNSDGELRFKAYDGYLYSQGSTEQEAYNNGFDHENYTFEKIK